MSVWLTVSIVLGLLAVAAFVWLLPHRPKSESAIRQNAFSQDSYDILLIGAGAMSTTLGMLLQQLDPNLRICMVERLESVAAESTEPMNNAGTGHAGNCELNYTPQLDNGDVDTTKAFKINTAFEVSMQLWAYLIENKRLNNPEEFIKRVPHCSFVFGEDDMAFLKKRYELLKDSVAFQGMEYSEDHEVLKKWFPLLMEGRSPNDHVAATYLPYGTDVNFGALACNMTEFLKRQENFELRTHRMVTDLMQRPEDKRWVVACENIETGKKEVVDAKFVFLGAGGGALPLLQKSCIPEGRGYGGFPVSGQWLICSNPEIVKRHHAKVYGKASVGAPPMSVPHLDTRTINGKDYLLFGPFAGATTKYLKKGSPLDLFKSLNWRNLVPMMAVGWFHMDLTAYLISEVLKGQKERTEALRDFYIKANPEDWTLAHAGKRVQIIKKDPKKGGKLQFGTEVVASADGSLAALLGASPGASTTASIMLEVIEKCFKDELANEGWTDRLKEMIPSYGSDLLKDDELFRKIREHNLEVLHITPEPPNT